MSEELRNKRAAKEQSNFDDKEDNETSNSVKVAVISDSSNVENFEENSVVLREDSSKVIIKLQQSPGKKSTILEQFDTINQEMKDETFENNESIEDKGNLSQKFYESILVKFYF